MHADIDQHEPVLIDEVVQCLQLEAASLVVDCTFGRAGYSAAILRELNKDGRVLALDVDPDAIAYGKRMFVNEPRLTLVHQNYSDMVETLDDLQMQGKIDGVVFDLGVSSAQLANAERGFSFQNDGPLDMRMNPGIGQGAAEWLSMVSVQELTKVIATLGEEHMAKRIAQKIIAARAHKAIESTAQLADVVSQSMPTRERQRRKTHPATKTFQAIRIHVNNELGHLRKGLGVALDALAAGGVIVVVSFHSLEDRIVKQLFRRRVLGRRLPDKLPVKSEALMGDFEYVAKLIKPSVQEIKKNARARSARLRAIRRVA